jgi:hypothetical protein
VHAGLIAKANTTHRARYCDANMDMHVTTRRRLHPAADQPPTEPDPSAWITPLEPELIGVESVMLRPA